MKDISQTEEYKVNFLESLVDPHIPNSGQFKRARSAPTKIKALYHLFQLNKNIVNGKWKSGKNVQGKKLIAKNAKISVKHFSEFVNSEDFQLLGKVTHRKYNTNIYELEKWVVDLFYFFEKKGMMKHFRDDFEKWRKNFLKRVHNWLLPLLRKGYCLQQILVNKLIDKKSLKGVDPNTLKGDAIKPKASPSRFSYEAFQGSRTKYGSESLSIVQQVEETAKELLNDFCIREGDIHWLISNLGLKSLKGGLMIRRKRSNWDPKSPIAGFMSCVNQYKMEKQNARRNTL